MRNTAKTINEIADDLGVIPVYVETEVEFLEEYGFLQAQKDKYIAGFIISEPTAELLTIQNDMYKRAAELFANHLYDEPISSGILDDQDIWCGPRWNGDGERILWQIDSEWSEREDSFRLKYSEESERIQTHTINVSLKIVFPRTTMHGLQNVVISKQTEIMTDTSNLHGRS